MSNALDCQARDCDQVAGFKLFHGDRFQQGLSAQFLNRELGFFAKGSKALDVYVAGVHRVSSETVVLSADARRARVFNSRLVRLSSSISLITVWVIPVNLPSSDWLISS